LVIWVNYACKNESEPESAELDLSKMKSGSGGGAGAALPQAMEMELLPPSEPISSDALILPKNENSKIIKTADVRFQVEKLGEGVEAIKRNVKSAGGYITSSNQSRESTQITTSFTIRVPIVKFDSLLNGIMEASVYTDYKNINAQDVTEEYVDIEARIKTKKALEQRYLELLKQAKNVKEILEVEEQLSKIREEIEAKEGRMKYLNDQVAYSTITLAIYQNLEIADRPDLPFYTKIWNNIKGGLGAFVDFFIGIFYYLPFILLAWIAFYFFRKWWRKRKA
jgi:hypothetical protein